MESPKVSIITRTRNREHFLARAAASVLGQQRPPAWEWIVVNDGGAPGPVEEVLADAAGRFPERIRLLHLPESRGMEHASNRGASLARGELMVIHDDDDSWDPAFLAEMSAWLDQRAHRGHAGVVCHSLRVVERVEKNIILPVEEGPFNEWLTGIDPWRLLQENCFPPISFLFRRSAYEEAGPFDETLPVLGDWEFNVRLILRWPIGVLPAPLARYHHRPRGETGPNANTITAGESDHRHWERVLRERWRKARPQVGLPAFGQLAAAAGALQQLRRDGQPTLSLPIRPGPQV